MGHDAREDAADLIGVGSNLQFPCHSKGSAGAGITQIALGAVDIALGDFCVPKAAACFVEITWRGNLEKNHSLNTDTAGCSIQRTNFVEAVNEQLVEEEGSHG